MKLLLFSDLHADRAAAQSLLARSAHCDVLVGAGDFANERHDIEACIEILRDVQRPTVLVAGNNETSEELTAACRDWPAAVVLQGSSVVIDGVTFYGLGGAVPVTPFGAWSYDFTEEQAADLLAGCPPGCVLVTHSPPKGVVDRSSQGASFGSIAIREAIQRYRPALAVCGHIHACAGLREMVGETSVINAGPVGIEWTVGQS